MMLWEGEGRGSLSVPVTGWHSPGPGGRRECHDWRTQRTPCGYNAHLRRKWGKWSWRGEQGPGREEPCMSFFWNRITFKIFSPIALGVIPESPF